MLSRITRLQRHENFVSSSLSSIPLVSTVVSKNTVELLSAFAFGSFSLFSTLCNLVIAERLRSFFLH